MHPIFSYSPELVVLIAFTIDREKLALLGHKNLLLRDKSEEMQLSCSQKHHHSPLTMGVWTSCSEETEKRAVWCLPWAPGQICNCKAWNEVMKSQGSVNNPRAHLTAEVLSLLWDSSTRVPETHLSHESWAATRMMATLHPELDLQQAGRAGTALPRVAQPL